MVKNISGAGRSLGWLVCSFVLFANVAMAEVKVRIDRASVDLNESFELEIMVDGSNDMEPDLSVLDEKFYRGQTSQSTNASIINGTITRSRTFRLALMAKQAGAQEVPAITVGNEKSEPIPITINEPTQAPPGEADVFITSEVDQTEAYVQSQILYRYRIYKAVPTRQDGGRGPQFGGVEVLFERSGNERRYEAILNGKAYNVIEQVLAVYPQSSGEVTISPARFEARVLRNGRITGRKVFESDSHTVKVLPIPAPPPEFPNAAWLPAKDVTLSDEWSREPDRIAAGEPLTRKVSTSVLGQIESQIPALELPDIDGMNVYADKPELSRSYDEDGIRGIRREQYALIGTRGGDVEIPALAVPWWDIDASEWKVARLEARTLQVAAPAAVETVAAPPQSEIPAETDSESPQTLIDPGIWLRVSQLLAAIWLLTVLAWWWSARERSTTEYKPEAPPIYKQQAKFIKAAKKAAQVSDKAALRSALLDWGRLQWPDSAPRSIGELANRVADPVKSELLALSASSYGAAGDRWSGAELARKLGAIKLAEEAAEDADKELLPPLMPAG